MPECGDLYCLVCGRAVVVHCCDLSGCHACSLRAFMPDPNSCVFCVSELQSLSAS